MTKKPIDVGRLAFRVEGNTWCAYWAKRDTMVGATLIASVNMEMVKTEKRKNQFMKLVREMFSDTVERHAGVRPLWPDPPEPAPEHERSGSA